MSSMRPGYIAATLVEVIDLLWWRRGPATCPHRILYPPTLDWDWMFQRPQQLLRQFGLHGWEVVFCNLTQITGGGLEVLGGNITVCHDFNEFRRSGTSIGVLWITDPRQAELVGELGEKLTVYDSLDEFTEWIPYQEEMLMNADLVLTSSYHLYVDRVRRHNNVCLVKNGCDFEHFHQDSVEPPQEYSLLRRPIVGYVGALGRWMDMELVKEVAVRLPTISVVMIGPSLGADLTGMPRNVYLFGRRDYSELPRHLDQMDVCIIPFADCEESQAVDPIKMYEYLAAGKPVVATNLPELQDLDPLVMLAGDRDEFIEQVSRLLEGKDKTTPEKRVEFARQNSWKQRFEQVNQALERTMKEVGVR